MTTPGRALLVGVAIADVTPPVGIDVTGFCLRLTTRSIHRSLRASAIVFSDSERTACLVAADLMGLPVEYATRLRTDIGERLGIDPDSVLIAASHTHNAPALTLAQKVGGRQDEWTELDRIYEPFWRARVISVCAQAAASVVPARLAASRDGLAAIGVNRRLRLPDGRMIIGRVPDRPADHSVGVVRIDRLDGTPLASILNYACHAISLGPEAEIVSPDYPGAARETLEAVTKAPAIFVQGAGGDVAPIDGMGPDPTIADALGTTLGLEAAKVWSTIETRNVERREEIVQSFNAIARLSKIELPLQAPYVGSAATWVDLPLLTPPTGAWIDEFSRSARAQLDQLLRDGAGEGQLNIQRAEVRWADYLEAARQEGPLVASAAGFVQTLRVGDVTFVGLPVEPFTMVGRALIEAIGPRTIVCGYANGTVGYCPMPSDYPEGGYEVERAHHLYGRPAALAPETAQLLIETGVRMASQLAADREAVTAS